MVGNYSLVGRFGAAIRVRRADGAVLRNGNHVLEAGGVTVDCGRRGEDDVGDIVTCHGAEQADCTVDICAVVFERDLARFTHSLPSVNVQSTYAAGGTLKDGDI